MMGDASNPEVYMMFFKIANLLDHSADPYDLLNHEPEPLSPSITGSKAKYKKWLSDEFSDGCLYSMIEGLNPAQRVGNDNPPTLIHGFVADFDSPWDDTALALWRSPDFPATLPNVIHRSFSGNLRAIYLFEKPVPVQSMKLAGFFLREVAQGLRSRKLYAGFDESSVNPRIYQDRGIHPLIRIHEEPVPAERVFLWLYKAGSRMDEWVDSDNDPAIPLKDIQKEMERRFPGRWQGPFNLRARGVRFWDPMADNDTAAVVRETGMQCFTGPVAFMPWADIFGREFTEQYMENNFGALAQRTCYDGKNFWFRDDAGDWKMETSSAFERVLKGRFNLSATSPRDFSQLDQALLFIQTNCRKDVVGPFVHFPPGPLKLEDYGDVLNTATAACMPPAEKSGEWGEDFPWIAEWLDTLFDDPAGEQKKYFFAWLWWFYSNALRHAPQPGQAIVLAGPADSGKTFLTTGLVARAVGGFSDATEFLMGNTEFSSDVCSVPLMSIDDSTPGAETKHHALYTAMVKKVTANQHLRFRKMRTDPVQVLWMGRTTITCNLDPQSMDLLPGLEQSNRDKVSLFLCKTPSVRFPATREERLALLDSELPFFLRWLLDHAPLDLVTGRRFGVAEYHHPALLAEASDRSTAQPLVEILETFIPLYANQHAITDKDPKDVPELGTMSAVGRVVRHPYLGICWAGTAAELASDIVGAPDCGRIKEFSLRQLSINLGKLVSQGMRVHKLRRGNSQLWVLPLTGGLSPQ